EQPLIKEIDINPLLATPERLVALDARVVLHARDVDLATIPRMAIRAYPRQFHHEYKLADGSDLYLRAIRPEDEPKLVKFHHTLSEHSVYMRYFHWMKLEQRTQHERLTRMCFVDYDRQMAIVAMVDNEIAGIGRLVKQRTAGDAELAVIVSDAYQRRGIGAKLMENLIAFAKAEKIQRITGTVLFENRPMRKLFERYGFTIKQGE